VLVILVLVLDYYFEKKQNKLKYIEALHEKIITNSFNSIVVADNNGEIIYVNNSTIELFGYEKNELVNQNLTILMPDSYATKHRKGMKNHKDTGQKNVIGKGKVQLEGRKKDGTTFPMHLILSTFNHNNKSYYSGEIHDLSSISKSEKERDFLFNQVTVLKNFYENILNNIPVDIAVFDKNHKYLFVNPQAIKNKELRKFIIGKDDFEYCNHVGRNTEIAELRRNQFNTIKKTRNIIEWEDSIQNKNGESDTTVLRKFFPVLDAKDEFEMIIGFGLDITESIKKDKELVKLAQYPKENPNIVGRFNYKLAPLYLNPTTKIFFENSEEKIKSFNQHIKAHIKKAIEKDITIRRDIIFENHTFDISFVPISENNYINIYGIDVTDYRREIKAQQQELITLNKKLKSYNIILEKDVEERTLVISKINMELNSSISYAKKLQHAIISHQNIAKGVFKDSFIFYSPKDIVGGDFYFTYKINDEIIFGVADCTGHGVPGAMLSLLCMTFLDSVVNTLKISNPQLILDKVNLLLKNSFKQEDFLIRDGMDISIINYNKKKSELTFSGANSKMLIIDKKESRLIEGDKQPIGYWLASENSSFKNTIIPINHGLNVFIFSDGLPDQFGGEKGKKLKYSKFYELLFSINNSSSNEQKKTLSKFTKDWIGDYEQIDDITIAGVKF
jgi:PAS domain S-box-containing protein